MKSYGAAYNRQGMSDTGQFLPRGTRLRWSGVVPQSGFLEANFATPAAVAQVLAATGLTVEDSHLEYASGWWNVNNSFYRLFITFVTPFDWNTTDLNSVVIREITRLIGDAPRDVTTQVLLTPTGVDAAGQPVYANVPASTPGQPGAGGGGWFDSVLQTITDGLGVSAESAQLILFGGLGLVALLVLKKK